MFNLTLDHIAISAVTLTEGTAYVEAMLGVKLQPGGKHDLMGTHNTLLGLADGLYLEVIAVDPDAPAPERPRWFDLDNFSGKPRITNWIARTSDMVSTLVALPVGSGFPVALSRGDLKWQMAVPCNGILPFDGVSPAVIQWESSAHPANKLDNSGCRLAKLTINHPDAENVGKILNPLLGDTRIEFENGSVGFVADIDTPSGTVRLT